MSEERCAFYEKNGRGPCGLEKESLRHYLSRYGWHTDLHDHPFVPPVKKEGSP